MKKLRETLLLATLLVCLIRPAAGQVFVTMWNYDEAQDRDVWMVGRADLDGGNFSIVFERTSPRSGRRLSVPTRARWNQLDL